MKILYVITDLNTGGVPLHLSRLAAHVRHKGHTVCVVSLAPAGPVAAAMRRGGVVVRSCEAAGPWDWRAIECLSGMIADSRPDLIHSILFHANIAARIAGVLTGFDRRRLICEVQTVEIERIWHLWVDRWTQRLCQLVVGNSPSVIAHLADRARLTPSKLQLVQGGVDLGAIRSAKPISRSALGLAEREPLLLWVGRLDPVKGLDILVQSAAQVAEHIPVQLALVGDGAYRGELERLIEAAGCSRCTHLLGTRPDVYRLLKTADMFVFPSRTEGLPNALMEALAAGLPTVTTDVAGCRDLVEHGVTGLLVPPDDVAALSAAILRVLRDGSFGVRLGTAAAEHASRNFRLEQCFESYITLYGQAVCHKPG